MNCQTCNHAPCTCGFTAEPYCDQCGDETPCTFKLDAACVFFHWKCTVPGGLPNLGIDCNTSLEEILIILDDLVGNNFNIPFEGQESETISWVMGGIAGHSPTAQVKVSEDEGNIIVIHDDGLYASAFSPGNTEQLELLIEELCESSAFEACLLSHETPITPVDTPSVNLSVSGVSDHVLQADVNISALDGNIITIEADGLYASAESSTGLEPDGAVNGLNVDAGVAKWGGDLIEHTEITDVTYNIKFRTNAFLLGSLTDVNTFAQPGGYGDGENRVLEGNHKIDLIGITAIPYNLFSGFVYATGLDEDTHQFLGVSSAVQFHFVDQMTFGAQTQDAVHAATVGLSGNNFTSVSTTFPITGYQAGIYLNDPAIIGETDSATPGVIADVAHYSVIPPNNEPGQALGDSPTITNLIGLNIEDFATGSAVGNVTNKFAILQKGAADISRFFGPVQNSASVTQFTSDERVKENINPYTRGLAEIEAIDVKSFNYTWKKDRNVVGIIAQQLEQIIPEAVEQGNFETPDKSISFDDFRMVDQNRLFYTMLNAIKELSAKVTALENK